MAVDAAAHVARIGDVLLREDAADPAPDLSGDDAMKDLDDSLMAQGKTDMRDATLADVLDWAKSVGEAADAIRELEKVPPRLGMLDTELFLLPADLEHFEKVVAPSAYGTVSRSKDVATAQRRANSRLRALLKRFHAAHVGPPQSASVRASYDALIAWMKEREGFTDRGAEFPSSAHKCLTTLRARCRVPLPDLDQAELDRVHAEATTGARKSLRKAIRRLEELRRGHNRWSDVQALLPRTPLTIPDSPDRARAISWDSFPAAFRSDADAVFDEVLADPRDLARTELKRVKAGKSTAKDVQALVQEKLKSRGRRPKSKANARASYRQAITWLAREQVDGADDTDALASLRQLFSAEALDKAIVAQIDRSRASASLKDPTESQTLSNRLTALRTIARHGLRDDEIVAQIDLMKFVHADYIVTPRDLTKEAARLCARLKKAPHLAVAFVNAPSRLATMARDELAKARAAGDQWAEEQALRRFAAATLFAIQLSRPLRTRNLFTLRLHATSDCPGNIAWLSERQHAEVTLAAAEVKNGQGLVVHVEDHDAEVLWDWIHIHRPRLMELRDLPGSPYLFPGTATPRLLRDGLTLPAGCLAPSSMAELWDLGERQVGLGATPHQCRHAVATLMLAVKPGSFDEVAAVLANSPDVCRKHYGRDSGESAARAVRDVLLAEHPDIFSRLSKRRT
ncbi:site-specific integrase [Rhodosalinus sediminis]|uniref:site-specific integrase n=1 Tax=Rhodosalinus sediminis TaxID=1940533 RepID=UPI00235381DB|nr:site-specific integrase [Rhodosalinus sediminis]